jgi:hypothetical protein
MSTGVDVSAPDRPALALGGVVVPLIAGIGDVRGRAEGYGQNEPDHHNEDASTFHRLLTSFARRASADMLA